MAYNTSAFIKALRARVNKILPCYYEEAPTKGYFPYAVLNGVHIVNLESGDLASFYLDIWMDEKNPVATETLESACDALRSSLHNEVISLRGVFAAHIGFENQSIIADNEFDIAHRRLSMSARIFYN